MWNEVSIGTIDIECLLIQVNSNAKAPVFTYFGAAISGLSLDVQYIVYLLLALFL